MLRVAIVGCGKIADQHLMAIRRIPGCEIVALCDREILMAKQLGERFHVNGCFSELQRMLEAGCPDVVHITTPPQSHFALARQCLQAGHHVYVEKPFTVTAAEAEDLIQTAEAAGLRITAGHNLQFTDEMIEMRRLLKQDFLGGKAAHVESYFSYDLGDTSYVGAVLGSPGHWLRRLPGQLFHNVISHGIAPLAFFLEDDVPDVMARAFRSRKLEKLREREILDELRLMLRDSKDTTAFFTFSTQIKPGLNQLRVYGQKNSLVVDHTSGSLIRQESRSDKSYLTYVLPPLRSAREHLRSAGKNLANVVRGRLYQDFGMKPLMESFYDSIRNRQEPPIPYREILLTARLMDRVFAQVYPQKAGDCAGTPLEATR